MKEYVLGFIFDQELKYVLLIKKVKGGRENELCGFLNGIGGAVEDGESRHASYYREVEEESTLNIKIYNSVNYGELNVPNFGKIYLFATQAKTTTDEEVSYHRVDNLRNLTDDGKLKGNVVWMIEMARNAILNLDSCRYFIINET